MPFFNKSESNPKIIYIKSTNFFLVVLMPVITAHMLEGRNKEMKKRLIKSNQQNQAKIFI